MAAIRGLTRRCCSTNCTSQAPPSLPTGNDTYRENKLASPQRPTSLSWWYRRGGFGRGTSKHRWSGAVRNGFSGKTITLGALVTRASRNPVSLMLIELRVVGGRGGRGIKTESNCGAAAPLTVLPARICSRQFDLSGLIADETRASGEFESKTFTLWFYLLLNPLQTRYIIREVCSRRL